MYLASGKVLQMFDLPSSRFAFIPLAVMGGLAFAARQWKLHNSRRLFVVPAVTLAAHALASVHLLEALSELAGRELRASIREEDQAPR